jgi:hypothetical protein
MTTQGNLDAIENGVGSFLRDQLEAGTGEVETIKAVEELTDEGSNIVIIDITFAASEQPLDPDQLVDLPFRVSQFLEASGEQRFCHVRIHFAEKQALRGW